MRTGPGIVPAIRLASHHARPGITAHLRFSFPDSGAGARSGRGTPPGSALADHVSADKPQARRLPVPWRPGRVAPGTMPPPASEPQLTRFLISKPRQKCPETDVS